MNHSGKGLFPCGEGWLSKEYSSHHRGIDIGWHKEPHIPVRAWKDGECIASGKDPNGSVYVVLRHDDGRWSGYWHLKDDDPGVRNRLRKGDTIKEGEKVGYRGNTGYATGVHLHFLVTEPGAPKTYSYAWMDTHTVDPLPLCYKKYTDYIENTSDNGQLPLPVKENLPQTEERNPAYHQTEVFATSLRCRKEPSLQGEILGFIPVGIYNVLEERIADGYLWVRIADNRWIATNEEEGWTKDLPAASGFPDKT